MISFKRILVQNFKRYRRVEIRPDDKKGLFVFLGKNYLGKSTFLNAICWCLYGDQPFRESIDEDISYEASLLNEDAKRENPYDEVRVELEIEDNGREYLFVRSWRPTQESRFKVMLKRKEDWVPSSNDETVIVESLLPKNLREYFIFAGEDAESLFSPGYELKLKNGILKVSNIDVLERLLDHVDSVKSELQRDSVRKGASDITKDAVEKKDKLQLDRIQKEERLKKLVIEIQKLNDTRNKYSKKIKQTAAYTEKIKRREVLERQRSNIKIDLDNQKKLTDNIIIEKAPFVYLRDILFNIKEQLTTDEEAGTIPPSIRVDFINELLEKRRCICGRSLSKADGSELKLKKLLDNISPADRLSPLLEDRYPINIIIKELPTIAFDIQSLQARRGKLLNDADQVERELKNISEELVGAREDEISGLEEGIQRIERSLDDNKREEAILTNDVEKINAEIKQLDNQIRAAVAINENLKKIKLQLNILEEASDNINFVRERITDRVRRLISKNTEKYFKELFWDRSEYNSIEFTEDYELEVSKKGFGAVSTEFSKGEKKVLGIATLRAIADLSGFSGVPIFFDAPLTNLGPEIETNILNMLPQLAPEKQVFIFNLDTEKIKEFVKTLPKNHVFELRKDTNNQNSTIINQINVK